MIGCDFCGRTDCDGAPRPIADRVKSLQEALDFFESRGLESLAVEYRAQLEKLSSPAGEGEPGSPGSGAQSARGVLEAPGGAVSVGPRGAQLELSLRALEGPPVASQSCAYCDRGAVLRVGAGEGEPRCMRHLGGAETRLPADLRRFARGR